MFDRFIKFINEREAIRKLKETGAPRPWTRDKHLNEWRFCNVNRCDDRETRWVFKNVIEPHRNHHALWFNLAIARFINWSPTLQALGFFEAWGDKERLKFLNTMQRRSMSGEKVYTGAYMIRAGTGPDALMPKHLYLVKRVFTPLWESRLHRPNHGEATCAQWDLFLGKIFGMGDFMRNQIITDYKYSPILPKHSTPDWETFVLAGPGTNRGLNRLYGCDLNHKWKAEHAANKLAVIRQEVRPRWNHATDTFDDLNNLSNCFCEFDKYCRLVEGTGQPRSRYIRSTAPLP